MTFLLSSMFWTLPKKHVERKSVVFKLKSSFFLFFSTWGKSTPNLVLIFTVDYVLYFCKIIIEKTKWLITKTLILTTNSNPEKKWIDQTCKTFFSIVYPKVFDYSLQFWVFKLKSCRLSCDLRRNEEYKPL